MKKNLFIILIVSSLCLGCSERYYMIDTKPQMKIVVKDLNGTKVSNAQVSLYLHEIDWAKNLNIISQKTTDISGEALFENLDEQIYYFRVEKDALNNILSISYFSTPLRKNEIRVIQTIIN